METQKTTQKLSHSTLRVYQNALDDFLKFLNQNRCHAFTPKPNDFSSWIANLKIRGLSDSTIRTYIAAASNFWGRELISGIERPAGIGNQTIALTQDQLRALILAIPHQRPAGAQTHAMLSLLLLTGWQGQQITRLTWSDFVVNRSHVALRTARDIQLPNSVWNSIVASVLAAYGTISPCDCLPIFVALQGFAGRARMRDARPAITVQELNRRLSNFACSANLPLSRLTTRNIVATAKSLNQKLIRELIKLDNIDNGYTPYRKRLWRRLRQLSA